MDSRILLILNIPPSTSGDVLYTLFGDFGSIRQVRLGSDEVTKGSAIVVFDRTEDADAARASLHGRALGERRTLSVSVFDTDVHKRQIVRRKRHREKEKEYHNLTHQSQ